MSISFVSTHIIISLLTITCISEQSCQFLDQRLPLSLSATIAVYWTHSNSVYLFGGTFNGYSGWNIVYKWDLYEPNSNFEEIGTTPTAKFMSYSNNGVLINDTVYFIGIYDGTYTSGNIYRYHLPTETWLNNTNLTKPDYPMTGGCLCTNDSHLFMVDGYEGQQLIDNDDSSVPHPIYIQIYDLERNEWITHNIYTVTNETYGWNSQYCSMVNNDLYIFGGHLSKYAPASKDIYKYQVGTNKWMRVGQLPSAEAGGKTLYYRDYILLIGTYPLIYDIRLFDVRREHLSNLTMTTKKYVADPGVVIIDDTLYIIGGNGKEVQTCSLSPLNRQSASTTSYLSTSTTNYLTDHIYSNNNSSATTELEESVVGKNDNGDLELLWIILANGAVVCCILIVIGICMKTKRKKSKNMIQIEKQVIMGKVRSISYDDNVNETEPGNVEYIIMGNTKTTKKGEHDYNIDFCDKVVEDKTDQITIGETGH